MTPSAAGIALLAGLLLVGGVLAVLTAFVPRVPALAEVLDGLDGRNDVPSGPGSPGRESEPSGSAGRVFRVPAFPLSARQRRQLQLKGISPVEHATDKVVWAVIGLVLPTVAVGCVGVLAGGIPLPVPVGVALLGLAVGFVVPDLRLHSQTKRTQNDAAQLLLTYIDLVTLERLANSSATQALHRAAEISEAPLLARVRVALQRAQLEQQSPYAELRRLAEDLQLPPLADLVDVMQLDDAGASLSDTLRARSRELRDAQLAAEQREAHAVSESLTVFMAVPALIFGVIFMVPPLLRILGP